MLIIVSMLLLAYPLLVSTSLNQHVGILALTMGIAATGWAVLGGHTGQISFGHAVYFAAGMYGTAVCVRAGWSPWLAMPLCAAGAGALAVLIGLPCFRLQGHYYAIATLAVGLIAQTLVTGINPLGAAQGLTLPAGPHSLWDLQFSLRDKTAYYYVVLALFATTTIVAWLFVRSRTGRYAAAIRDDPRAAAAIGIPVLRYKLISAALSGSITAVAGCFHVMVTLFVDPSNVDLTVSSTIVVIAILGGASSLWGPLLGAWLFVAVQEYTRTYLSIPGRTTDWVAAGALLVVVAVANPSGLTGIIRRVGCRITTTASRRSHASTHATTLDQDTQA